MRENMDPLTPATMERITGMAEEIAGSLKKNLHKGSSHADTGDNLRMEENKKQQHATVRWVLDAPRRLKSLQEDGKREEAARDWGEIRSLLETWKVVKGASEIQEQCERIMQR